VDVPSAWITVIGSAAAVCTTAAFVPQVVRVVRLRRADEISLGTFSLFAVGTLVWTVFGVLLSAWPIILANAITFVLAMTIVALKLRYDRARKDSRA